jgi:hypothetical protein
MVAFLRIGFILSPTADPAEVKLALVPDGSSPSVLPGKGQPWTLRKISIPR